MGDPPRAYYKTLQPVAIDEAFYETAAKYGMFENQYRINMLMNMVEKQRLQRLADEAIAGEND